MFFFGAQSWNEVEFLHIILVVSYGQFFSNKIQL
jgi:hypothetical protein